MLLVLACSSEPTPPPLATSFPTPLPLDEWTEVFGSGRLLGALLDHLTRNVQILKINRETYRLKRSRGNATSMSADAPDDAQPAQDPSRVQFSDSVSNPSCPVNSTTLVVHHPVAPLVHPAAALDMYIDTLGWCTYTSPVSIV